MNKKRSFVLSDSTVTLGKFKTFDCEEKSLEYQKIFPALQWYLEAVGFQTKKLKI